MNQEKKQFIVRTYDEYKEQNWANGQGRTKEIWAAHQADAPWAWRLSMATIQQSSDFSRFEGIDRILVPLEGQFELISRDSNAKTIPRLHQPIFFQGEEKMQATLIDHQALDFNWMTRRDFARPSISRISLGEHFSEVRLADFLFLFVLSGRVLAKINDEQVAIEKYGTLICEDSLTVDLEANEAALLVGNLSPLTI